MILQESMGLSLYINNLTSHNLFHVQMWAEMVVILTRPRKKRKVVSAVNACGQIWETRD